jgi:hypothetical protein
MNFSEFISAREEQESRKAVHPSEIPEKWIHFCRFHLTRPALPRSMNPSGSRYENKESDVKLHSRAFVMSVSRVRERPIRFVDERTFISLLLFSASLVVSIEASLDRFSSPLCTSFFGKKRRNCSVDSPTPNNQL